ncbi:hypothetical protein [Aquipuribacter sp. SD81]|uniref:hypothetical protein n=1 Tax=Aquipuribacter sp. SD81 TaxID=3127703 RepID=UPI003016D7C7
MPAARAATRTPLTTVPRQRRGRPEADLPLGSLTQREHRQEACCSACGGTRLTRLVMHLADGAAVDFVSCHHCEHRSWEEAGRTVPVTEVLARSGRR